MSDAPETTPIPPQAEPEDDAAALGDEADEVGRKTRMRSAMAETPTDLYDALFNELEHGELHELLVLKSYASVHNSKCSPGWRTIQARMGGDDRSLAKWTRALVRKGWLKYRDVPCKGSNRIHHRIYIILDGCGTPFFERLKQLKAGVKGTEPRPGKSGQKDKGERASFTRGNQGGNSCPENSGDFTRNTRGDFTRGNPGTSEETTKTHSSRYPLDSSRESGSPTALSAVAVAPPTAANAVGTPSSPGEQENSNADATRIAEISKATALVEQIHLRDERTHLQLFRYVRSYDKEKWPKFNREIDGETKQILFAEELRNIGRLPASEQAAALGQWKADMITWVESLHPKPEQPQPNH